MPTPMISLAGVDEVFILCVFGVMLLVLNFVVRSNVNHFELLVQSAYTVVICVSYLLILFHLYTVIRTCYFAMRLSLGGEWGAW